MKLGTLIAGIAVVLAALLIYGAYLYTTDSPHRISASEAKRRIQAGEIDLILDVRTPLERSTLGFYPGSVPIPSADLDVRMPAAYPNKQTRILARMATDKLHGLGYTNAVFISSTYGSLL